MGKSPPFAKYAKDGAPSSSFVESTIGKKTQEDDQKIGR